MIKILEKCTKEENNPNLDGLMDYSWAMKHSCWVIAPCFCSLGCSRNLPKFSIPFALWMLSFVVECN